MGIYFGAFARQILRDTMFLIVLVIANVVWFAGLAFLLSWILFS